MQITWTTDVFYHAQYIALATIQTNSELTSLAKVSFLKHPSLPFVSIKECDVREAIGPGGKRNDWVWGGHFPKGVLGLALWRSPSHFWQGHWAELKPQGKMSVSNRIHFWGPHCSLLLPTMVPSDPWEVFTDNRFSMASRTCVWYGITQTTDLTCRCPEGKKEARGSDTSCRWPVTILRSSVSINSCVIFTLELLWFVHFAKIFAVWGGFQLERRKRGWTT